jgi:Plavaka transposase
MLKYTVFINQQDLIAEDPNTHGAMFVPIILGSDKTTVSVGMGGTGYYPIYAAIGNTHNGLRRAHKNALVLVGFLSIPKGKLLVTTFRFDSELISIFTVGKEDSDTESFRDFKRQLFHTSVTKILECLKPAMTTPEVVRTYDGHFRRSIYGIGPYIADYQEQVTVSCIVQGWCAK